MRTFSIILCLSATPAFAFLGSGGTNVSQEYACVSLDGVPIQNGSEMAQRCCSGGQLIANAPNTCRAGFNTIGAAAGESAAFSIHIAQNTLQVAQNMNGATTDFSNSGQSGGSTSGAGSSSSQADTGAIQGGGSTSDLDGSSTASNAASGAGSYAAGNSSGSGAGSGSGASGGGSLGGGLSPLDSSSGASGKNAAGSANGAGNGQDTRLAYVHGNGNADGSRSQGLNGFASSGSGVGMDKAMDELKMGDENANRDPNALAHGDEDGALGTAEDPADYFKRIDQSANIFKIVSSRYMKKKSLFQVKP